nr:hypothetical protein [Streptomyces yatensis]
MRAGHADIGAGPVSRWRRWPGWGPSRWSRWTGPGRRGRAAPASGDEFTRAEPGGQWMWQANADPAWWSLRRSPGRLALVCQPSPVADDLRPVPHVLTGPAGQGPRRRHGTARLTGPGARWAGADTVPLRGRSGSSDGARSHGASTCRTP